VGRRGYRETVGSGRSSGGPGGPSPSPGPKGTGAHRLEGTQPGPVTPGGGPPVDLSGTSAAGEPGGEAGEAAARELLGESPPVANGSLRRRMLWRVAALALTAFFLYLLAPSLFRVFGSVQDLGRIHPLWFPAILGLQAASFVCIWYLLRLALRTRKWFAVATSQLAGNAFSRVVPAGAAAGVALQYRMMANAGINTARAASSLAAVSLLTLAITLSLPVLALPAMLGGAADAGLVRAALLGGVVFVAMVVIGALLLFSDPVLRALGEAGQWVSNRVRRHREPRTNLPDRLVAERNRLKRSLQSKWWEALLAAVGRSMFDYASLLAALLAVGANPNPALVILAFVASQVLVMVPITPGGLGFVEAGLVGTLTLAGVPVALAAVATLAYRLASYWIPMLVGGVAYAWFQARYRHQIRERSINGAGSRAQARG